MKTIQKSPSGRSKIFAKFGISRNTWNRQNLPSADEITQADLGYYGAGATTISSLLVSGQRTARTRQLIYDKWSQMESDPIISTALKILVTSALGGHETSGDLVFVESRPDVAKRDKRNYYIDAIKAELVPLFNQVAFTTSYLATGFGDAYARIHTSKNGGVQDLYIGELIRPMLVQPFERGSRTVGYAVSVGDKHFERLNSLQMARMKMPRTQWIPQVGVLEKALRYSIGIDDVEDMPVLPAMVGGSFLYSAEIPYDNLSASLVGLVGQRWMDSIDEQMIGVNLTTMNKQQQHSFMESIVGMLRKSKEIAENAVKTNSPIMERIRHIIPTFNDKQVTQITGTNGSQRSANISIEDIMLHARLLAGALGVDLSMLGFADQLSGGLGDGGFFRTSAQIGESSRIIRTAQAEFYNHIVDVHTYKKYGFVFNPEDRPYSVNFYGSISALESEKQRTRAEAMNVGLMLVQAIQQMKELGADQAMMKTFLTQTMLLDEDVAEKYSQIVLMSVNHDEG
jgi:hypothetical protein